MLRAKAGYGTHADPLGLLGERVGPTGLSELALLGVHPSSFQDVPNSQPELLHSFVFDEYEGLDPAGRADEIFWVCLGG